MGSKVSLFCGTVGTHTFRYSGSRVFLATNLPLPAAVVEKIHRLCRNFLWNSKRAPVAWEDICHPKTRVALASDIPRLGMWLFLPEFYGTFTARQTHFGYSGSMLSTSKEDQFGIGNRRRAIHHFFNGLPKFATESLTLLARPRRQSSTWPDGAAVRDLIRPKHMSTLGQTSKTALADGNMEGIHPTEILIHFVAWASGRLSTRDRLMFLQEDSSCSLCINMQETAKHLFFECPFSNFVWTNIRQWLGIRRHMSTLLSAVKWLIKEKTRSSVQNKARLIALACTVYSLWRHRNEVIFEGKTPCPEELVISIKITVYRILLSLFPHELITY
ncbi:UNVERIFIED_CONTAM: hypothetical protein Sangu_3037200 [Sesamum angustifolium]|uniref:Reverse transcriptase zinc-binding domain-containing protein n=1 Tax=Sesamum angustifolium TaxID=2727405 RepID=A0AAW2KF73_9LAMI